MPRLCSSPRAYTLNRNEITLRKQMSSYNTPQFMITVYICGFTIMTIPPFHISLLKSMAHSLLWKMPTKGWAIIFLHPIFNFVFQDDVFPNKIPSQPAYRLQAIIFNKCQKASLLGEVLIHMKMSLHTAPHILIKLSHWQSTFNNTSSIYKNSFHCHKK